MQGQGKRHPAGAPAAGAPPAAVERRSGRDRRVADHGPPSGRRDRRVGVEPRKPEVQELDLSLSDWAALDEEPVAPLPTILPVPPTDPDTPGSKPR